MKTTITRRDILKLAGGSALGILFTPIPWKLLDDTAIWSQNWSLIPKLNHGPITEKFTVCPLCPAGCGVKARCVSGIPFALTGVAHHPLSHGYICPRGFAGHHFAYHPLRLTIPHKFSAKGPNGRLKPVSMETALKEIASAIRESTGSVVVFDKYPQRTISKLYSFFSGHLKNGIHATLPTGEDATLSALDLMSNNKQLSHCYHFSQADVIVSFGAPLLEGFGNPGEINEVYNTRKAKNAEFIQIESLQSRTALQSDQWISINPGTEGILALSIAYVVVNEKGFHKNEHAAISDFDAFKKYLLHFTPEITEAATSVSAKTVYDLGKKLIAANSPIILSGSNPAGGPLDKESEKAIAGLNVLLGKIGKSGGIAVKEIKSKNDLPGLQEIPDGSISVLFIDAYQTGYEYPPQLIQRKLDPNKNLVVSLSPFLCEESAVADFIIPTSTFYETLQDIPPARSSFEDSFSVSQPLIQKPKGTIEEEEFFAQLGVLLNIPPYPVKNSDRLKQRIGEIFDSQKGSVFSFKDGFSKQVSTFANADELFQVLKDGGTWVCNPQLVNPHSTYSLGVKILNTFRYRNEIVLIPTGKWGELTSTSVPPILSKVYQESELQLNGRTVLLNPLTMIAAGLTEDSKAHIGTKNGTITVNVKKSETVPPNSISLRVGPLANKSHVSEYLMNCSVLSLCDISDDGTWRITKASITKAEHA